MILPVFFGGHPDLPKDPSGAQERDPRTSLRLRDSSTKGSCTLWPFLLRQTSLKPSLDPPTFTSNINTA
ncbi:hypothetical protein H9L39_10821 [Fusarium oxysporum f. sp. albedinis]|nr:hypothetical protein H9L39_10821 [Fusarium oxysporum f. sp. albedinis]